ncbi:hypothetical protein [Leuconostoc citreum]|uniref:hypothetical protein n=1 Tax=Leuconostoc citreum TaxID=33964 RepID=UPI0032DE5718
MSFAKFVTKNRIKMGLSRRQLSILSNIQLLRIHRIEEGRKLYANEVTRLAKGLGVSESEILVRVDQDYEEKVEEERKRTLQQALERMQNEKN